MCAQCHQAVKLCPGLSISCPDLETNVQVITANSGISEKGGLLERLGLQSNATQRRGTRFEGIRFSMYDFAAYVAQVTELSGSREFLGILVEVEYLPVQSSVVAAPVLKVICQ